MLDIVCQVTESLEFQLDMRRSFGVPVPLHSEDHALVEMGLDDYLTVTRAVAI